MKSIGENQLFYALYIYMFSVVLYVVPFSAFVLVNDLRDFSQAFATGHVHEESRNFSTSHSHLCCAFPGDHRNFVM